MSEAYAREILRRNVAQICQTIGWNGINSIPVDIMVQVCEKYIRALGTQANQYAEQFNRTAPNLHDLGLVFRDLHINLSELVEYIESVPSVPPPVNTERFPKPKESNLNFLKPGSHEVVTRPMHVHEHLPPMYPEKERDTPAVAGTVEIRQNGIDNVDNNATCTSPNISVTDSPDKSKDIFKRPVDPVSLSNSKRPRLRLDEEERAREISSVMMTMSGFLSPAREGKLPEAKHPTFVSERHHDKHKVNSHHPNAANPILAEKVDKKSKKNKLLNGKVTKSKRKDKSHKGESSKSKDSSKLDRCPPGHPIKSKDVHPTHHNHVTMPAPKVLPPPPPPPPVKTVTPQPSTSSTPMPTPEAIRPVIKQEPLDPPPPPPSKSFLPGEEAIPVPRRIPISKSPLVPNSSPVPIQKAPSSTNAIIPEVDIKKEVIDEEEKLASQPDRSKVNIFKRISNKSKEDKIAPEVVPEKSQLENMISRLQNSLQDSSSENIRIKSEPEPEPIVNNNNSSALDLSREIDIRAHEVISIDDDSMDNLPMPLPRPVVPEHRPSISINKLLQVPFPKDVASVSPKIKKERKHKEKKDKTAKLEAKLIKKQQQQLAYEMAQAEKKKLKLSNAKSPKSGRPKNESKLPQLPPGYPFFPGMAPGRGLMPGPGLIPTPGLIPGSDFLAGLANNPALRGIPGPNLLSNPFALGTGGPGLIPGPSFLPGGFGPGIPNHLMPPMGNFSHSSRSSSMKIPQMLRRPSLEVIPVDNEDNRGMHKTIMMPRDRDRNEKHKAQTIPNILQKQKSKSNKDHKANLYKMPPVQPDITIELNPPKMDPIRQEPPRQPTPPPRLPTPQPTIVSPEPRSEPQQSEPIKTPVSNDLPIKDVVDAEKKKDKAHKKEKKDKDGIKIKKKKDKKDKSKEKAEKKREKEERQELKDRIKKEKKEKKKEKVADGLVPKLTLKLSSSNSNSPMPPSSPDLFKLNIKPVVKREDEEAPVNNESISREHSRSPELAQISALVTRPPKQKHTKHNNVVEIEGQSSSPPPISSPPRKNRPPSSHSKYKRILFKPMAKKGHGEEFNEDAASISEETSVATPVPINKPMGPLPTPYYVDDHGNKIWVCPACGQQDNGSPMIGCDGCDGWYHWVCVGITEEPGATEDWFCKSCLAKRAAMVLAGVTTSGKKRGRKPKGEKIRDCH